jgi:hypothetical protein
MPSSETLGDRPSSAGFASRLPMNYAAPAPTAESRTGDGIRWWRYEPSKRLIWSLTSVGLAKALVAPTG